MKRVKWKEKGSCQGGSEVKEDRARLGARWQCRQFFGSAVWLGSKFQLQFGFGWLVLAGIASIVDDLCIAVQAVSGFPAS